MSKINLTEVNPRTPTEFALLQYAKRLEQENQHLKMMENIAPQVDLLCAEMTVEQSVMDRAWLQGIAIAEVTAKHEGQEFLVKGRTDDSTKHFQIGMFIHQNEFRDKTFVAEKMYDFSQRCLRAIAGIYGADK